MAARTSKADGGFTLVEMLVALAVFALLAAASTSILGVTLSSRDTVAELSSDHRTIQVMRSLLKGDIAQMVARQTRDAQGGQAPTSMDGGTAIINDPGALLRFAKRGWINPGGRAGRGNIQHILYRFEGNALIREVRMRPDPGPTTEVTRRTILTGVSNITVRFFDGRTWDENWSVGDYTSNTLPRAIEFEIQMEGDEAPISHLFVAKGAAP